MKQVSVNWSKWNRTQFFQSLKCWFGFHEFEDFEFTHMDDNSRHEVEACLHCGSMRVSKTKFDQGYLK